MSGKRYPGELKIEAVKQVVDRDLPPELTPGMILATSALGRLQSFIRTIHKPCEGDL